MRKKNENCERKDGKDIFVVAHLIATEGLKNRVFTYLLNRVPPGAEAVADEERRWTERQRELRGRTFEVGGVLQLDVLVTIKKDEMWRGMVYPEGHDKCGWRWFTDGRFSVAAAHRPLPIAKWMPKDNGRSAVDCPTAWSVWARIVPLDDQATFFITSVKDWGKGDDGDVLIDMVVDLDLQPKVSWKQMLLGKGNPGQEEGYAKVDSVEYL
ncbi:hypothetical protein PVK06_005248 [Gossypium arboreum]|uniref:Uncharacterized protein n=1 Tax=Gossypium arboreum TaxID=29729 RepID=A0ABR0QVF3_GOSAR|nr:hypothetical protein PVK06_005248 [Gossypium arboreum]